MGLGDAKLMAMIGAWFGPAQTGLIFFIAVIAGALYGLALIAASIATRPSRAPEEAPGRDLPTRVPLGAFLCLAAIYALFWGGPTLNWYLRLFT